jgi:hypothetical protein
MSSWDTGPFDNDGAMNFVGSLEHMSPDKSAARIGEGMADVVQATGYISAARMNVAIAGACLVCALTGARNAVSSPFVRDWVVAAGFAPPPALTELALAVFDRAFEPVDNEWFDLWYAGGRIDEVREGLAPFRQVLVMP